MSLAKSHAKGAKRAAPRRGRNKGDSGRRGDRRKGPRREPLACYVGLPYPVTLYPDPVEGGFVAELKDLPGCLTQGDTADEALRMAEDAKRAWLTTAYEAGDEIPRPSIDETYSGRILVRVPRSLHRRLVDRALAEGVSLNQWIVTLLART